MKSPITNIKWRWRARQYVKDHPSVLESTRRPGSNYPSHNNDELPDRTGPLREYSLRDAVVALRGRKDKWAERRKDWPTNIAAGLLVAAGVVGLFAFFVVLGGLLFLFAWNVGVDEIAAAAGYESIENISFVQALAGSVLISVLGRLFRGDNSITVRKDA